MEKTIREWLNELPEPYRSLALKNATEKSTRINRNEIDISEALYGAFRWSTTPEGYAFWSNVYDHYWIGSPLPELPNSESKE